MFIPSRNQVVGTAVVGLMVGLGVSFYRQYPDWEQWAEAEKEAERLDEFGQLSKEQNEFNYQLLTDLVAGRVSFAEAIDLLIRVNAGRPGFLDMVRVYYPAPSLEESVARNLLHRVEVLGRTSPPAWATVLPGLKDEYASMFGHRPPPGPDGDQSSPPGEAAPGGGSPSQSVR